MHFVSKSAVRAVEGGIAVCLGASPAMFAASCSHGMVTGSSNAAATSPASCQPGATLTGASYDIAKSRFAFGSTPAPEDAGSLVRWVGRDGVVAIFQGGEELGSLNGGAPEANLPDWSSDTAALAAHVSAYFESMGVAACQIATPGVLSSASGGGSVDGGSFVVAGPTSVVLSRAVDGIPVVESLAGARFDTDDQTTEEDFYWPEVPASVVVDARSLRDRLADPRVLAAYKATLPSNAQGDGQVVIHHSIGGSAPPLRAAATYDVTTSGLFPTTLSFDANGQPVTMPL
ncbi:MAG TPA: hypothetical protein VE987_21695 [Polyangiaceae bacterium]|nr:hypothetical protein [Polyangiaceae bacterium]